MERYKKKDMLQTVDTLLRANDAIVKTGRSNPQGAAEALVQCQESAIALGTYLDTLGGQYGELVHILEDYCENIYQMSESLSDENVCWKLSKKIQKQLTTLQNGVKYKLPEDRKEIVFLPYKASMWDSLESVWKAADADPDCDAYVIPIPYFDKNPDGSFREEHYEGDLYPKDVPVTRYDEYDLEARHPDVIYIHNPYDECNHVTSVHPFFYSKNLRNFTNKLVYIPYFILGEEIYESMCVSPGTVYADVVVAHSLRAKEDYVKHLKKFYMDNNGISGEKAEKMLRGKILPLGSPKIDKVVNDSRETDSLPEVWRKKLEGKKAVLYNTGVSGILHGNEQELKKIKDTIAFFAGRDDVVLWWRPHPLMGGTMQSMRPQLLEEYKAIVEEYKESGIGIYDDTAELHRAVLWTDMYYGDGSSLVYLYGVQGKPVVMQNIGLFAASQADEAEQSVVYEVSCCAGDSVFFTPRNFNRLYRLDLKKKEVADLGEVPGEYQTESALYSNMIHRNGVLWLIPSRAGALAEYDLRQKQWRRYELPDRIKYAKEIDGKIYMISADYRYLWKIDLNERGLEREEIIYQKEEELTRSDEYYNDDLYLVNGKLYYLITHSNTLAVYDMESHKVKLQHIGSGEKRFQRLLYDDGGFWFFPRDRQNGVCYWDGVTLRESGENIYPENFSLEWGISHVASRRDGIWLFPLTGNMVLRMDRETMRTECVIDFGENLRTLNVQQLPEGNLGFVVADYLSASKCSIVILGEDNALLDQYRVERPDSMVKDSSGLFDRLDTSEYDSVFAYQTRETPEYGLAQICDALGHGKLTYEAERNYFRSLYANSDGTAGIRIWEEVTR